MKHEFKPGDLAMIKQCTTYPPAIGRCVELIALLPGKTSTMHSGRSFHNVSEGNAWLVHSTEGFPLNSVGFGLIEFITDPVALFAEHLLMPLRGDEHDDLITTERPAELVSA